MASNVRFVDSLKVGAYQTQDGNGGGGSSITILDNVDNYVLSATGDPTTIQGNSKLIFDGTRLGIGEASSGARLQVSDNSGEDLMLIKNSSTNKGIKVDGDGIFQLIEFDSLPTAKEGGIIYSSNNFYVGLV
jgi:hypothetical protein